jgi:hypothetical protein
MRPNITSRFEGRLVTGLCLLVMTLSMVIPAFSQAPLSTTTTTRNWWAPGNTTKDTIEKGKFNELQAKKKVYLSISFSDTRQDSISPTERKAVETAVKDSVTAQKGLQLVNVPDTADFAVLVRTSTGTGGGDRPNFALALDDDAEVSVEVTVIVPGTKQANGSFVPRVVWESSSPHAQVEAPAAARFTVDGFLWELKKLQEKK